VFLKFSALILTDLKNSCIFATNLILTLSEGTKSPLFLSVKMMRERIEAILEKEFEADPSLFLIDLTISADNCIRVILDGDRGVTANDCIRISRRIEHDLNQDDLDFALEVMSAGLSEPLVFSRQYKKNIGRNLEIKTKDGAVHKGKVLAATDTGCTLTYKVREPKPVGKGKHTVVKEVEIPYEDIMEAKVMITF